MPMGKRYAQFRHCNKVFFVVALLGAIGFGAFSGAIAGEASEQVESNNEVGEKVVGPFQMEGTVKDALTKLTNTSGVPIEFAEGVELQEREHLASSTSLVLKNTTVRGILEILLMGSRMTYSEHQGEILIELAKSDFGADFPHKPKEGLEVVMVVEFDTRQNIFYSGISGAEFWFKIRQVHRFDEPRKPEIEYLTLRKRSAELDCYHNLQISITGQGDSANEAVKSFDSTIKEKNKFILCGPANAVSTQGTQLENFWGSITHDRFFIIPFSEENLRNIDERYTSWSRAKQKTSPDHPNSNPGNLQHDPDVN